MGVGKGADGRGKRGKGYRGGTHPLQVHALHRLVHAAHDRRHVARHRAHRHRGLDPARNGVDAARQPEKIQRLALLADRIRGIDAGAVVIALLQRLNAARAGESVPAQGSTGDAPSLAGIFLHSRPSALS